MHLFPTSRNAGAGGELPLHAHKYLRSERNDCFRRWCCSGTPISTEVKDFTGQFAFLGVEPFGDKAYFNNFVCPVPIPSHIYLCKNAACMCSA